MQTRCRYLSPNQQYQSTEKMDDLLPMLPKPWANFCLISVFNCGVSTVIKPGGHKAGEKIPEFSRLFQRHKLTFSIGYRNKK